MTLNEAKQILDDAKECMKYGSQHDVVCHAHKLVNALEYLISEHEKKQIKKEI